MTILDLQDILELFHFERYNQTSLGKLYGVSKQRIAEIINRKDVTFNNDRDCIFGDGEEAITYYIDGNQENEKPQNKIKLCIVHRKKFEHRQLNKRIATIRSQS